MEQHKKSPPDSLGASLEYQPVELKFGTSGRRGEVVHLTQLEVYINAVAEMEYLLSLPKDEGGIRIGQNFYIGHDLRPSSTRFVPEQGGRGEIAQAIMTAVSDAGLRPVNLGAIPTPAVAYYALLHGCGSIMVTGSHIPFDRNGYKTYSAKGELRKQDEEPINARADEVRRRVYGQPLAESKFNPNGMFKTGHVELPQVQTDWKQTYANRYYDFFCGTATGPASKPQRQSVLAGLRVLVYEHSAVGRDILADILMSFGADVVRAGRSEQFVPIDTENFDAHLAATIEKLAAEAWSKHGRIDAVVSTDGDSDRPLVIGVEPTHSPNAPCRISFFGGDLVGMVTAEFLKPDAVVVPISCNDGIDLGPLRHVVQPKTRIGSPYVIAGMEQARNLGRRAVCGFEANGGFLVGTDIHRDNGMLRALPTRDAVLPILCVLARARAEGVSLSELFTKLPPRFGKAALLKQFPSAKGRAIIQRLSPARREICDVFFVDGDLRCVAFNNQPLETTAEDKARLGQILSILSELFNSKLGFGPITRINYIDGVRIWFQNGDVAHVRPSGNADELRIYAVASTPERADAIADMAVREPDGILRQMERALT
ncbi:MAG: hypothetical protein ACP5MD_01750 [Verrucomicrobiia bacterium]